MHNYKDLKLWQKAIELSTLTYKLTSTFPKDERYGLISQIQRAVVSIPSNVAEGCGRNSDKELNHFLAIATGSSFELETQLLIARNLGFTENVLLEQVLTQLTEVQKMIYGLKNSLKV